MNKILSLLIALTGYTAIAALPVTTDDAYKIDRKDKINRDASAGTNLYNGQQFGVKATWDFSVHGATSEATIKLDDAEGQDVKLPAHAVVTDCLIDVVTSPTSTFSGYHKGKLSFGISNDAISDLKATTFIESLVSSTGRYACIPEGTEANMIEVASEATVQMRVGSEALSAGKINLWLQYVLSD